MNNKNCSPITMYKCPSKTNKIFKAEKQMQGLGYRDEEKSYDHPCAIAALTCQSSFSPKQNRKDW